jgi:hypothetical protein
MPNIPGGAKILGIKGFAAEDKIDYLSGHLDAAEFEQYESFDYVPEEDNTKIMVKLDLVGSYGRFNDSRFDKNGVAILPASEPLPDFGETDADSGYVRYQLLGFIDGEDRLISWKSETAYVTQLIDWCVINKFKQNYVEETLLNNAIPIGAHLVGLLSTQKDARAYLEYFDEKYGTSFTPLEDPRFPYSKRKFDNPTEDDYRLLRELSRTAHHFMTNPR